MKHSLIRSTRAFTLDKAELALVAASEGSLSLVDQIFTLVTDAIKQQRIAKGMRMPSVRQLAENCGISRDTAARAYDKLVAHGLLESRRGSGFYVRSRTVRQPQERTDAYPGRLNTDEKLVWMRFRLMLLKPLPALKSYSGIGYLPDTWMDETSIEGELRTVARGNQRVLGQVGDPQGFLPLRNQLQLKLHDMGIYVEPANIILTSGAADALNLIIQVYLNTPGECVLVEQPCQPLLVQRLMANGLEMLCVPRSTDGPDLETLRELCEKHRPRFFFCSSVLHNPTGNHLTPPIAFQLLQLAEEFDLTIIEDDTYGDLLPQGLTSAPTRLAPLDQLRRVIYIGSFSKTLAPGLRVGYLAANTSHIEWLTMNRALYCIASNSLAERTVYRLLTQGNYRHHCEQIRMRLSSLRPLAAEALQALDVHIDYEPDAGFYLWGNLGDGINAFELAQKMLQQGHLVAPGGMFSLIHPSYMRVNVAEVLNNGLLPVLAQQLSVLRGR
ncbi:aminotransferase-like domain-containing protein [Serratia ficaria]|uniref:aminotransferase-like domain-containing protein n=1 Tax=Serratia ficaria TaxID=61651 RepID=UPI002177E422|nr:PLP-dependent aminotransferase family protein [Serratia ficaria]CAI1201323.1 2-aminoadipate transaminase [Serratia ficaria]CAI2536371.1 2-aminoadipate transaminase [Serratia ficaria]